VERGRKASAAARHANDTAVAFGKQTPPTVEVGLDLEPGPFQFASRSKKQ
jgi:hypothetical protein